MLECRDLTCVRNDKKLFTGLSFKLAKGKSLIIKGHNGSGKTSLLCIIAGLLDAQSGEVKWRRKNINYDPFSFREDLIYIGHKNALKEYQTVGQNLQFWRDVYGAKPTAFNAAIKKLRLKELLDMPCNMLSAGMRRRVALARLLLSPAKLWLLDEPFSHLDKKHVKIFSTIIKQHNKKGGVAVITSHNKKIKGEVLEL